MKKVLLFGASGNLGKKIAEALREENYDTTAVVRNKEKVVGLEEFIRRHVIADVTNKNALTGICNGYDIVISSLGKSVSPNDKNKPSFREIDLNSNSHILNEAVKNNVKKFVYVSALHAEHYPHLEYFAVHHQFSEQLIQSGIDYSIIKPPALFSAFIDLIEMAKKGRLITIGKGDKLTNPIYEGDLARICVESIHQTNSVIEAGGKEVLSRRQINEIIQNIIAPAKKTRTVPIQLVKSILPIMKLFSKNMYDKVAFFTAVMQDDTIAPKLGTLRLGEYIKTQMSFSPNSFRILSLFNEC